MLLAIFTKQEVQLNGLREYGPDKEWIVNIDQYFRRSNGFAAWRKVDKRIAICLAHDILNFIWCGGSRCNNILRFPVNGGNWSGEAGVSVVDIPDYDNSKPTGCQLMWLEDMPASRLQNIEKEIRNWLKVFNWELSSLHFYYEDGELM